MPTLTQSYSEALWPNKVRIFGRTMQPYCIGHALLLHRVRSPFVTQQVPDGDGVPELCLALWICSRTWQKAAAGLWTRRVRWLLKLWNRQLRKPKCAPAIVAAETQFARYVAQAWDGPSFWEKQHDGPVSTPGAPLLANLKVTLMAGMHCSEEKALSWHVRAALFDTAAWGEIQGKVEIVSERELAAIEASEQLNTRN
jgi:hypothetical protein